MENRLKVNLFMPFYLWNNDIDRVSLTHKILIHYNNIKEKFNSQIYFKFYFVGSENNLSKTIVDKYYKDSYYEFEQPGLLEPWNKQTMNKQLAEKVRFGVNLAITNDCDVLLVAGSNDFVSDDFFINLIKNYNVNVPQIYGIGDYYNGKNIVGLIPYKSGMSINLTAADNIWWKGYRNCSYDKYCRDTSLIKHDYMLYDFPNEFTGGIIGLNKKIFKEKEILEGLDHSERLLECRCRTLIPNLHVVTTNNVVNLNVKCLSGADLHSVQDIKEIESESHILQLQIQLDTLDLAEMDTLLKNNLTKNIEYFNNL